jgi:hypothetical protein
VIVPADYATAIPDLEFTKDPRSVYATLFHYNYVGSYTALAMPFFCAVAAAPAFSRRLRVACGTVAVVLAFVWATCGTRAGVVGGAVALLLVAIAHRHRLRPRWRLWGVAVCLAALVLAVLDATTGGRIARRTRALTLDLATAARMVEAPRAVPPIRDARVEGDRLFLEDRGRAISVLKSRGSLIFTDDAGRVLDAEMDGNTGRFTIRDLRFREMQWSSED